MSDEILSLEDNGPALPAADALPAAADAPGAEPAEAEHPDAVEVGGQRMVPVGALVAERKQRQELATKAARVDELEAYARDSKPYVDFLKANPGILSQRQQPPAQPSGFVAPQPVDPKTEALAKTLDLYTPDGKPDLARASYIRGMMAETAQQMAQQAIAPMHRQSAQDQSARNYQLALTVKDAQGRTPSPAALQQIWRTMSPEQTADPNVASILALTALGLDSVTTKAAPLAPANAPLVTEVLGGGARRPSLSALETAIAKDRGISESKWAENTAGFQKGRAQQLED